MRAFFLKLGAPFGIDESRCRIGKFADGIPMRVHALGLNEYSPAGAEAAQRVVEARGDGDEFGRRRGIEIGPAKTRRTLEGAVLIENDALLDQRCPRQEVGQVLAAAAILG